MSVSNFCKRFTTICKLSTSVTPNLILSRKFGRSYTKSPVLKVTVVGAAGHVGQPLCLMLKQCPLIDELAVYDLLDPCPFATELGHVDTKAKISSYMGQGQLRGALEGSKIVVVLAAARRSSGVPFPQMFSANCHIMLNLAKEFANSCPHALFAIVTNPVNSLVPLIGEALRKTGVKNPKALFGVTTINSVRANTFAAEILGLEPECVFVPVIGGNLDKTIVPLFSQTRPCCDFSNEELEKLTNDVQNAHNEVLRAKNKQSGYLTCAFAVARFVISLIKGVRNQRNITECAFVKSDIHSNSKYLATPLLLGPGGIQKYLGLPSMTEYESCLLENAATMLNYDVEKGEHFVLAEGEAPPEIEKPICPAQAPPTCK